MVVELGDVVALIPMAALVAAMIFVSVATFDWHSIKPSTLRMVPKSKTTVMAVALVNTVWTHHLAIRLGVGVLTAMVLFTNWVAHLVTVEWRIEAHLGDRIAKYEAKGEPSVAASNDRSTQFNYVDAPHSVAIDMYNSHLWDASTIAGLGAITAKYENDGKIVEIEGLNTASLNMCERMGGKLDGSHSPYAVGLTSGAPGSLVGNVIVEPTVRTYFL